MSEYILELQGIKKAFSGVTVLENVDFRLKKGSIHALVGGNGAGKSTLMKILTGVYFSDSGTCKLDGKLITIKNYNDAKKNGISLIFQELSLIPTLSVSENIFLNKEPKIGKLIDYKKMNKKASEILTELGIEIDVRTKVQELGVGFCQLIEIAKALSNNTSILVMDEPTASLSDKETEVLFNIIAGLKKKKISIVYISHRMNEIFKIADEISVLYGGKMAVNKPVWDYTLESLIEYMLGGKKNEQAMEWKNRENPVGKTNLLEVKSLNLANLVKDVSFEVKEGEVVGLAGLMGSGRTEVLETIFGLRKRQAGEILLSGKPVHFRSVKEAVKGGIALVPEDRRREGLVLSHTLRENMILTNFKSVQKSGFVSTGKMNDISSEAVKNLGIKTDSIKSKLSNLSGGNQQKVVIAKWLNTNPKLLMMDEPTAGVDINAKSEIIEIIRQFVKLGNSVLFVSSELSEMMAICDRIVVLHDGRKTGEILQSDLKSEEVLQRAIQN